MKLEAGILGATGMVGQQLVRLLENHPWFELKWVAASGRSAGRTYVEAAPWRLASPDARPDPGTCEWRSADRAVGHAWSSPGWIPRRRGKSSRNLPAAVMSSSATPAISAWNRMCPCWCRRSTPSISGCWPHKNRAGGKGKLVTNPNCSAITLTMALAPLERAFGLKRVLVTTLQAVSGAGYPGVASLDILGNVIPFHSQRGRKDRGGNAQDSRAAAQR